MEQPNKYYFIIRSHKIVIEADSSILTIMEKLQSYKSKVTLNFEVFLLVSCISFTYGFFFLFFAKLLVLMVQGAQYKLGDFMVRLIKVVPNQAENLRGILMEVNYYWVLASLVFVC